MQLREIRIREAVPSDAPGIARLYLQLTGNPSVHVDSARIDAMAADPRTALFVCEQDHAIIGTALVALCLDAMFGDQPFAVLENIIIDSTLAGSGIGTRLMQDIERFCTEHDCSKIMLASAARRLDAHRFFEQCGFSGDSKRAFVKYRRQFAPSG